MSTAALARWCWKAPVGVVASAALQLPWLWFVEVERDRLDASHDVQEEVDGEPREAAVDR